MYLHRKHDGRVEFMEDEATVNARGLSVRSKNVYRIISDIPKANPLEVVLDFDASKIEYNETFRTATIRFEIKTLTDAHKLQRLSATNGMACEAIANEYTKSSTTFEFVYQDEVYIPTVDMRTLITTNLLAQYLGVGGISDITIPVFRRRVSVSDADLILTNPEKGPQYEYFPMALDLAGVELQEVLRQYLVYQKELLTSMKQRCHNECYANYNDFVMANRRM